MFKYKVRPIFCISDVFISILLKQVHTYFRPYDTSIVYVVCTTFFREAAALEACVTIHLRSVCLETARIQQHLALACYFRTSTE